MPLDIDNMGEDSVTNDAQLPSETDSEDLDINMETGTRKLCKRKNDNESDPIDNASLDNSPVVKKVCKPSDQGLVSAMLQQVSAVFLPKFDYLTKEMAEMKKNQNLSQNLSQNCSQVSNRSTNRSRSSRYNALENSFFEADEEVAELTQSQQEASQDQASSSTPMSVSPVFESRSRSKSSGSRSSSLQSVLDNQRSRSASRQRIIHAVGSNSGDNPFGGGFGRGHEPPAGNEHRTNVGQTNRGRQQTSFPSGGRGGHGRQRENWDNDDQAVGTMSRSEMFRMFSAISRNTTNQANKSMAFAAKEVILTGFIEVGDDISLAYEKLKEVYPSLRRLDIQMVSRFKIPDETGNKPLKVVLHRESIIREIVEAIETPDDNGETISHIRRGLTWQQRSANARVRRQVEDLNSQIPEGHPDRWEVRQVGGYQFAVQPEGQKKKPFVKKVSSHLMNGNRRPETRAPVQHQVGGEPKPSTSSAASLRTKTTLTRASVTLAEAEGALESANLAVASSNPASKNSATKNASQSSGTSKKKDNRQKAKNSRANQTNQPRQQPQKHPQQPPRQPPQQPPQQQPQQTQDSSLMTDEEKRAMLKKLQADLKHLQADLKNSRSTRSSSSKKP